MGGKGTGLEPAPQEVSVRRGGLHRPSLRGVSKLNHNLDSPAVLCREDRPPCPVENPLSDRRTAEA